MYKGASSSAESEDNIRIGTFYCLRRRPCLIQLRIKTGISGLPLIFSSAKLHTVCWYGDVSGHSPTVIRSASVPSSEKST
jgi:hypothetical protein